MALPTYVGIADRNQTAGAGGSMPAASAQADDLDLWITETAAQALSLFGGSENGAALVTGSAQDGGTTTRVQWFYRVWDGAAGDPLMGDSGDHQMCRGIALRGVDTSDPFDVIATGEGASGTSLTIDLDAVSTTRDDCLIVIGVVADLPDVGAFDSTEFSGLSAPNLTNVTERGESTADQGNGGALFIGTGELATAGPIGQIDLTSVTTSVKAWSVLAVQPPAAGGGGSTKGIAVRHHIMRMFQ